jgi:nucleoside-diphosphate-sugar epimerase
MLTQAKPYPHVHPADLVDVVPSLKSAQVLVTGGTGFIGGRLVERLLIECNVRPRVIVRNYARAASLARFGLDRVQLIKAELNDPDAVARAVEGCSAVLHCAWDRSDPQSNVTGINVLIQSCIKHRARLVHVSTFGVYEPLPNGDLNEEVRPVRSGIPYSDAKLDLEDAVMAAVETGELDAVVVLPTIVYGPYGRAWTVNPVREMINTGAIILPANGGGLCNAVYLDDVCQGIIRAAAIPAARGRRYLISGSEPITWSAFYRSIATALDLAGPRLVSNDEIGRRMTALKVIVGDRSKVMRWTPIRLLRAALTATSPAVKAKLKKLYGRHAPPLGMPSPQQISLFSAKCRVVIDRARDELGYRPSYDFERGSRITAQWLRWAIRPPAQ